MKKRFLAALSTVLCVTFAAMLVGCGEEKKPASSGPKFNGSDEWLEQGISVPDAELALGTDLVRPGKASVHDPSIFLDPESDTYYAFGSHFAVASSEDLVDWTQVANDSKDGVSSGLFGKNKSIADVAPLTVAAANGQTDIWAPDVEYIDGTYYLYFSITTAFGSNRSIISRLSSDSVLGPYENEEIIIRSKGENGDAPNAIDSELFYDKEGRLWMTYGSFFGGIYIKELYTSGEKAGLPIEEKGYGERIWARGSNVEGPFIFYNAETDYYYLMVSEGSLSSDYTMRVARSENPNGPYVDSTGANVGETAKKGNFLAGNYKMATSTIGYGAMGHNSVTKKDGEYYVIHHTRWTNGTEIDGGAHTLYTTKMYFNEEEWPVLSPNRYCGEEAGTAEAATLAGTYDVVVHNTVRSKTCVNSVRYTFTADGKILSGETQEGTWAMNENGFYVDITLKEISYKGVVCASFSIGQMKWTYSFTANSTTGGALWAEGFVS